MRSIGYSSVVAASPGVRTAATARTASSWTGCRLAVSGGQQNSALRVPSKETTAMSSGRRRPAWRKAWSEPMACRSELTKMAVGRGMAVRISRAAA
jgi:hypothetical protein